MIVVNAFIKGR